MTKAPRPTRDSEVLRQASRHLFYEVQMLEKTRERLNPPPTDDFTRNTLVESFVVHARNLIHFLQPEGEMSSDVLAEDYFDGGREAWERIFARVVEFEDARKRANKELAHLTYDRLSRPEGRPWRSVALGKVILDGVDLFVKRVDPTLLHPDWRKEGGNRPRPLLSETIVPDHTGPITDLRTRFLP